MSETDLEVHERLIQLFEHLHIERAHFAAAQDQDYRGMVTRHPEAFASLTLVCATGIDSALLRPLSDRLLFVHGNSGPSAFVAARALSALPGAAEVILDGYVDAFWSDPIADRRNEIGDALLEALDHRTRLGGLGSVSLPVGEGSVADISYRIQGVGPPLVLLPLALAPSQWGPLIPRLSERFCTITLTGARLGMVAQLEERVQMVWYRGMLRNLVDAADLHPGEDVLEVGCGAGAVARWLAQHTAGANRIVGIDVNRYLLAEAAALTRRDGLEDVVEYREGNALNLPIGENEFDVTLCVTVLEEGDADRMLAELVRVTKPGGRVAVMVRAVDLPWWLNVHVPAELKARAEASAGGVAELGCADASLAARMCAAGLTDVQMSPQLARVSPGPRQTVQLARIRASLNAEDLEAWQAAVDQAQADGSFGLAQPFHCAVGTKP